MSDIVERLRRWEVSCDMKEARDTITALRADLAARDAEIERLRALLDLYREAVRIDATMEGPSFMGSNASALKRAWEADMAVFNGEEGRT